MITATLLVGCAEFESEEVRDFEGEQPTDTVAIVGGPNEVRPLLVYNDPMEPLLADSTTVLYADNVGGRIVMVDLLTGEGWEVNDGGGAGPGEFGGMMPFTSISEGRVLTFSQTGARAQRSSAGDLLSEQTGRMLYSPEFDLFPAGLLGTGDPVVFFREKPDWSVVGRQTLAHGVKVLSPDGERWTYALSDSAVVEVELRDDGSRGARTIGGDGVVVHGRGNTVVLGSKAGMQLLTLSTDGEVLAEVPMSEDPYKGFVDAQGRVWIQTWAKNSERRGSYIVYDRDLTELRRVIANGLADAFGDFLLSRRMDDLGAVQLVLSTLPR